MIFLTLGWDILALVSDKCILYIWFIYILYALCLASHMIFYILVLLWVFCALIGRKIGCGVKEVEYRRIIGKHGRNISFQRLAPSCLWHVITCRSQKAKILTTRSNTSKFCITRPCRLKHGYAYAQAICRFLEDWRSMCNQPLARPCFGKAWPCWR